jgi:hypothetical protein
MKEIFAEVMAVGAVLLSPQPTEQPAVAESASSVEILADNESSASAQIVLSEAPELAPADNDPAKYDMVLLRKQESLIRPESIQSMDIPPEMLDPDSVIFWLEMGLAGLGLTGGTGLFTSRKLKKSLDRNYTAIKGEGMSAQDKLHTVLEAAKQQADGLRDDDVLKLRALIRAHDATSLELFNALTATGAEFDTEHDRFFALKGRLRKAPNMAIVLKNTKIAAKQAEALQTELDRVKTDLAEIDINLGRAESAVSDVHDDLAALTRRGWDVTKYEERATSLTADMGAARAKRSQNYVDEPTEIARTTTGEALKLQEKAAALEPRRTAADEVYGTQSGRLAEASNTAKAIRARLAKLKGGYSESCLEGFEDVEVELIEALGALSSAHATGGTLTGDQGKSVQAVKHSERLSKAFDMALGEIESIDQNLQVRDKHLATLVEELPDQIDTLSARFDRAMMLVEDPDVEDDAAVSIRALTKRVARLSASISTSKGSKPDYLDIERRHQKLAEELARAHDTAATQKQEMNDLRGKVPQLKDGYNDLVGTIAKFAKEESLSDDAMSYVRKLQLYKYDVATDRKNLKQQRSKLEEKLRYAYQVLKYVEDDTGKDGELLEAAKLVGGVALLVVGINILG